MAASLWIHFSRIRTRVSGKDRPESGLNNWIRVLPLSVRIQVLVDFEWLDPDKDLVFLKGLIRIRFFLNKRIDSLILFLIKKI